MASPVPATSPSVEAQAQRMAALDWMRGLVMILMALDHASQIYNAEKLPGFDSWILYIPGTELSFGQFITRWITHLCAPTFLFLAGTALALSLERRRLAGASPRDLDRYLLTRGLIIVAIEMTWFFPFFIQVLYAIGMSILCMIPLRRLSTRVLIILAIAFMAGSELINSGILALSGYESGWLQERLAWGSPGDIGEDASFEPPPREPLGWFTLALPFFIPGIVANVGPIPVEILYPFVPWLVMMMLGWVLGRYLIAYQQEGHTLRKPETVLLLWGIAAVVVFGVIRGINGYGNMYLLREGGTLMQWLNVSKYPPSLSFFTLELGLMALCLAGFLRFQAARPKAPRLYNPLLVFGQTAMFFYLFHMHIMGFARGFITQGLGIPLDFGLPGTYLVAFADLCIMYPLCIWFRRYKTTHRQSWVRYI